jgi:D-serine deaminase-like pyridoxal phosphate-dependent protein
MNEEHGILESPKGNTGLYPGQVLRITPIHICTAINMQNTVYEYYEGKLDKRRVDARGMSV